MGVLKDIIESIKDPEVFGDVSAIIHRIESAGDIEEMTAYPVTRKDMAKRMDDFFAAINNDQRVMDAKKEIGSNAMQKAWAEDLQNIHGWKELASRIPDVPVCALYQNRAWDITTAMDGVQLVETGNQYTVSGLYDALRTKCIGIRYSADGKTLNLTAMSMPDTQHVVLILE